MKLASLILASALLSSFAFADSKPKYEAGTYQLDPSHSTISFEAPHLKFSSVGGTFKLKEGTLTLDDKVEKSKVTAVIDIATVNTNEAKRDEHLRSPDFFDASKYPTMKFEGTGFKGSLDKLQIVGNLTIKDKTKPVTLDAVYKGFVPNDGFGNKRAFFEAKTVINRQEYGLTYNQLIEKLPAVGDEITISLKIEAVQPSKQAAADKPAEKKAK